jgi:hypothetical protein
MLLDVYKLYSNNNVIICYVVALLAYNAEQYCRNNKTFRDIFSMSSSGSIKHFFSSWNRMDIPKRLITPTILLRVITQKSYIISFIAAKTLKHVIIAYIMSYLRENWSRLISILCDVRVLFDGDRSRSFIRHINGVDYKYWFQSIPFRYFRIWYM